MKSFISVRMNLGQKVITEQDIVNDQITYFKLQQIPYDDNEIVLTFRQICKNWKEIRLVFRREWDWVNNEKHNFRLVRKDCC